MKKYGYMAAVLAALLYISPVMANSVELSTERGADTQVWGYFSTDRASLTPHAYSDSVQLSSEKGFAGSAGSDVRGYFSTERTVESSLDLSRENGAS